MEAQSPSVLKTDKFSKRARTDLLLTIGATLAVLGLAHIYDIAENWEVLADHYEDWEIDEIPYSLAIMSFGLTWYAIRRWKEFKIKAKEADDANDCLVREIAQHEQTSAALISAKAAAEEAASRAEAASTAKSDFLASMSHEVRTPMNGVLGMASVLMLSDLSPKQREQVSLIKHSGEVLLSLLNDILDLAKIEAGHVELEVVDFDVTELLDLVSALWVSQFDAKGLQFKLKTAADLPAAVRGDPTRIRQVLFNLISNAMKFADEGSVTVTVSSKTREDGKLELHFSVTDTGTGINRDAQSQIFSKFTQADNSITRKYGGTGLGLTISEKLVRMMDGEIGLESIEGLGSTFWFTAICLPGDSIKLVTDTDVQIIEDANRFDPPIADDRLRILVAEDNNVNQAVLRSVLEKSGHHINIVANGVEAIAAVMRQRFDVVLMDIQMPEMDGVTATEKIRSLPGAVSEVPIIALTANAMLGDRERYLEAGMTDYLSKPVKPVQLFALLANFGTEAQKSASQHLADLHDIPSPNYQMQSDTAESDAAQLSQRSA